MIFASIQIIFTLAVAFVSPFCLGQSVDSFDLSSELEILPAELANVDVIEVPNLKGWVPAKSDAGKAHVRFQGNWYRLTIQSPQAGEWVLIHPLVAHLQMYRFKQGAIQATEHGYSTSGPKKLSYRKLAIPMGILDGKETVYFKTQGLSQRSTNRYELVSMVSFLNQISAEVPLAALYYSLIIVVAGVSLFAFFMLRSRIYIFYSLYLISTMGIFVGIQGYGYQYFRFWKPGISMFFFGMASLFITLFIRELFRISSKRINYSAFAVATAAFCFSLFSLIAPAKLVFTGLYTVVPITQMFIVFVGIYHIFFHRSDVWMILLICITSFVSLIGLLNDVMLLPFAGFFDAAFQPVSLIEILLFGLLLLRRFYLLNVERLNALELAQQREVQNSIIEKEKTQLKFQAEFGMLARQIAHDIRSPLSALTAVAENLGSESADKSEILQKASQRINSIANDLLSAAREIKVTGDHRSDAAVISVNQILRASIDEKLHEVPAIRIETELPTNDVVKIRFCEKMLHRILSNLLNNAIEACTPGSTIRLALKASAGTVQIRIIDNGKGIPQEILTRLGDEQVSFGKLAGNGIGVFSAKKQIEVAGGNFSIQSKVGEGTTVTLIFPMVS